MARPITISVQQILDAARAVFTERGPLATTAEIAHRAGCSEGSIFRRFDNKQELFLAAMGVRLPDEWLADVCDRAGEGNVPDNLRAIAGKLVDYFVDLVPRVLVLLGSGVRPAQIMPMPGQWPPVRAIERVAAYLRAETELGRLRDIDAEAVARTVVGAIHFYAFTQVTGVNRSRPMGRDRFLDGLVDTVVHGVEAETR